MDNFIVSARKYRPATFISVVGQNHITSTLKNAITRNQLAHAYLFCGPRGVGKTTCARIFAKAINCTDPKDGEACGQCESCRSFNEGRSFSIHELDAASNNSVDDIRTLTDQVRIPPQIGRYSVYIIDEVHMLSAAAFNAFLKTLEEPPAHAIFILATTEKHKIIPTILSRCQIYDFNRIKVEDSVGYLKHIASQEGVAVDDESLNLIAQKADGGMRDALSMFDKAVAFCGSELHFKDVARTLNVLDYDTYFSVTDMIGAGDYKSALVLFDEVLRAGFSGLTFVAGLNTHFRDLLMCKDPNTLPLLEVTGSLLQRYKEQSGRYDAGFLFEAISLLSGIDGSFKVATNQRLHVELGLMKLCALAQKKTEVTSDRQPLPPLQGNGSGSPAINNTQSSSPAPQNRMAVTDSSSDAVPQRKTEDKANNPDSGGVAQRMETLTAERSGDQSAQNVQVPAADQTLPAGGPGQRSAPTKGNAVETVGDGLQATPTAGKGVSGFSINDILNGKSKPADNSGPLLQETKVDPQSESKIMAAKAEFIEKLSQRRPRIATALSQMVAKGNVVCADVSTDLLREDILLHQKEILNLLCDIAQIRGDLRIEIGVKEDNTAVRPIRPEDKLAFFQGKNPLIDELRRELNLEME